MNGFIGVIRSLITTDQGLLQVHGLQIKRRPGLHTRSLCIPDQPRPAYNGETEEQTVPRIILMAPGLTHHAAIAVSRPLGTRREVTMQTS